MFKIHNLIKVLLCYKIDNTKKKKECNMVGGNSNNESLFYRG